MMDKHMYVFTAVWCGPCSSMKKVISMSKYQGRITVLDLDEDRESFQEDQVRVVPTIIVTNEDGEVMFRKEGVLALEDIDALLQDYE